MNHSLNDIEYYDYSDIERYLNKEDDQDQVINKCDYYYTNSIRTPISIKITDNFDDSEFIGIPFNNNQVNEIKKYTVTKRDNEFKKVYQVKSNNIAIYHESEYMDKIIENIKIGLGIDKNEDVDYLFSKMVISTNQICNKDERRNLEYLNISRTNKIKKESNENGSDDENDQEEDEDNEEEEDDDDDDDDDEDSDYSSTDHIATIILTLPSRHKGGDIILKDNSNNKEQRFKTDKPFESAQEILYLGFYSDCAFNINSVIEGNHIYLVFKLYKTSSNQYSSKLLHKLQNNKDISFKLYNSVKSVLNLKSELIYVLENEYQEPLSFNKLVQKDKQVADKLNSLIKLDPKFNVYIAQLEIEKERIGNKTNYLISSNIEGDKKSYEDFSYILPSGCLDHLDPISFKRKLNSTNAKYTVYSLIIKINK